MSRALLALEKGALFRGASMGVDGQALGEVVFNTAMTGYQEILTDPSYARQLVTLTHPHIGNTGVNGEDDEAAEPQAAGLVVRELAQHASSWRSTGLLGDYLRRQGLVAIAGLDTRRLTRILREEGAQNGCILTADSITANHERQALALARSFPGLKGMDLAKEVTAPRAYSWREGSWRLGSGYVRRDRFDFKVVAYDYGVKRNILRLLVDRGCRVEVVPATTPASRVLGMQPDGVFLSNGPGDPAPCDYAIAAIGELLETGIPLFGICLGLQLLGLAAGMQAVKMPFGHHGANHPVQRLADGRVLITSQNHGFCLDDAQLPPGVEITHRSLFDDSIQGIRLKGKPAFGFQGHPEASPGPHDAQPIFDQFIALMRARKEAGHA